MKKGNASRPEAAAVPALAGLLLIVAAAGPFAKDEIAPFAQPPFTQRSQDAWLNSRPLTLDDLEGRVVVLDFWTFDCWNCYRSFPWLKRLEASFADRDVRFLGVHSPEFAHEHDRQRVEAKVKAFGLEHPVMMDNDFAYWTAMGNRAWPAFYLVDRRGKVRYRFYGETHEGDRQARAIETAIERLLNETAPPP